MVCGSSEQATKPTTKEGDTVDCMWLWPPMEPDPLSNSLLFACVVWCGDECHAVVWLSCPCIVWQKRTITCVTQLSMCCVNWGSMCCETWIPCCCVTFLSMYCVTDKDHHLCHSVVHVLCDVEIPVVWHESHILCDFELVPWLCDLGINMLCDKNRMFLCDFPVHALCHKQQASLVLVTCPCLKLHGDPGVVTSIPCLIVIMLSMYCVTSWCHDLQLSLMWHGDPCVVWMNSMLCDFPVHSLCDKKRP